MQHNALKRTIAHFGASFHINLTGSPEAVTREVNRLANHGALSLSGDTYEPVTDETYVPNVSTHVTVKSHLGRWENGIRSIAVCNVARNLKGAEKLPKREAEHTFNVLRDKEFATIMALFERVENIPSQKPRVDTYGRVSGFGVKEGGDE